MPPPTTKSAPHRSIERLATGLLILAVLLYIAARSNEATYPVLAYVRAFAEAAVVGALADWFAVTALFRRPLGLPIPHTEIISLNKDRIAAGIGRFIETNFLAPETLADRLGGADLAGALARWAGTPAGSEMIAQRLTQSLPALLEALERHGARRWLHDAAMARISEAKLAPIAAEIVARLVSSGNHQPLVDRALDELSAVLAEQETTIREQVAESTSWLWRTLRMDERVADGAVTVLRELIRQTRETPEHPLRQRLDRAMLEFAERMRGGEEFAEEMARLKEALVAHPALGAYLDSAWDELRGRILADAAKRDSELKTKFAELIAGLAATVQNDEAVHQKLNRSFRAALIQLVEARRAEVGSLVEDMVKQWDAKTLASKVENEIGRDLQYIRINGTVIGGLVGLGLHVLSAALS
jgi:uncharacterized membrane-anchored protein YjiN (DUF445 family)